MGRLDQFVADLERTGLIEPADLERARAGLAGGSDGDDPAGLARVLIDRGKLTPYQARKVLAGATRGFVLGGYVIRRPLGEGGMGKVYLATHRDRGGRVAIKVLPPRKALEEEQALRRFRREMDLSRRVDHPNLARTLEVGCEDGVHFMIMEYIPGDSLYNVVKRDGPLRVPDATRYLLKVLGGLEAAHGAGLIHRDIKPSNLMITPDGDARVLDLGLARAMGEESPLTRPDAVIGTLDYASPEQLGNAAAADRRSDLYSLGCTLYFALAGRPPFEGGDVINKIYKQRMEDPEPLERVARGVPAAFAAIVRKLMAKDPADRYRDVPELRADLARWSDPAVVRAILGAEAETARAFRPPPPELDDRDLFVFDDEGSTGSLHRLRDLGDAEPSTAPMYRPPPPPRTALVVPPRDDEPVVPHFNDPEADDLRWLVRVIVAAFVLGLAAVIAISIAS